MTAIGRSASPSAVRAAPPIALDDLWRELVAPLGVPTITGFPFGHEPNPLTLPLGCLAALDARSADACALTVLEPAVS